MTLLYFYIQEYKNLSNIGLSLSNQDRFFFDPLTSVLSRKPNPNFIDNFFAENISHLTGIVGDNGSGKSNAFKVIMDCLVHKDNGNHKKIFVVYEHNGRLCLYNPVAMHIEVDGDSIPQIVVGARSPSHATVVYFTNHYEFLDQDQGELNTTEMQGLYNLSLSHLIQSDMINRANIDTSQSNRTFKEVMNNHRYYELTRHVRLFRKYKSDELLVKLPRYLVIAISSVDQEHWSKREKEVLEALDRMGKNPLGSNKERYLFFAFKAALLNFLVRWNFSINVGIENILIFFRQQIITFCKESDGFSFFDALAFLSRLSDSYSMSLVRQKLDRLREMLEKLDVLIKSDQRVAQRGNAIYVNIINDNVSDLQGFLDVFFESEEITQPFDLRFSHNRFEFTGYSSGEHAMLAIFSRLLWMAKKDLDQDLVLMIDEAELCLHPRWQTYFLNTLLVFLEKEFPSRKLQLIIASHSPFILSDLPSHCLVLLKKELLVDFDRPDLKEYRTVIQDGLELHSQTFGANIHQLFSERFFLKDALMGEFARKKIEALVKDVVEHNGLFSQREMEILRPRIELIGEPFIRAKLWEMLTERLAPDSLAHQVAEAEMKLDELKRKLNDQDPK